MPLDFMRLHGIIKANESNTSAHRRRPFQAGAEKGKRCKSVAAPAAVRRISNANATVRPHGKARSGNEAKPEDLPLSERDFFGGKERACLPVSGTPNGCGMLLSKQKGLFFLPKNQEEQNSMNQKKLALILALVLALSLALAACTPAEPLPAAEPTLEPTAEPTPEATPEPTAAPASEATVLTDMLGREVELPGEVKTIISLAASNTEIVYAIGAGDMLVGRDASSNYPEEAANVAVVGDYNGPNIEAIVAAEADVVLASYLQDDVITQLTELGIAVFCTEASDYEGIYTSIELVGTICGKVDEAAALCAQMRASIGAVQSAAATENQPTVYYVMSFGEYGEWSGGPGSFINTAIELAGGVPVTNGMEAAWVNPSIEQVVELDPDVILLSSYYTVEDLSAANGYADMRAVQEGNVYPVNPDLVERPGPRIAEAVTQFGEIFAAYLAENQAA